ncbi:MAG TPA: hypothetical protein PLE30_09980 [Candidatus Kapabacteria bacterium]|nr:hypothetical protein [Candidatus Kapabacteria bacterium]
MYKINNIFVLVIFLILLNSCNESSLTTENSKSNALNSTEKQCLLICSSVARYSLVHWFEWTVENNITDIPSKIYKDKYPILMEPKKATTKVANKGASHTTPGQKAAGKIAAADFVGAYCGFLNSMFGGAAVGALGFSAAAAISEI